MAALSTTTTMVTRRGHPRAKGVPGHGSPAGELLHTALIRLPLKGVEVALGYGRLLGAQGPMS
jgi:hypothetical protein